MKRLLLALVLAGACLVGVGFYRGWLALSDDTAAGKANVTLTVDKDKMKADTEQAEKKVQDLGHRATEKIGGGSGEK